MINITEMTKMNQDVLNAVTASSETANKVLQQIASEATDFSKKSYEDGTTAAEKLAAVKSLDKALEIQAIMQNLLTKHLLLNQLKLANCTKILQKTLSKRLKHQRLQLKQKLNPPKQALSGP